VTAGLEIRSAATTPPPPRAKYCEPYVDEVVLQPSLSAQPIGLKLVDAGTATFESRRITGYPSLPYESLVARSLAVSEPAVVALAPTSLTLATAYILFLLTQATTGPASFTSMLDSNLGKPTTDTLEGYEQFNQRNWDGYDAEPITAETQRYARRLLRVMPDSFGRPDIAPSGDGFIGLEWVPDDGPLDRLFLDIGPGEEWSAYWKLRSGAFGRLHGAGFDSQTKQHLQNLFADLSGLPDVADGR
jgi:hypothetical protein